MTPFSSNILLTHFEFPFYDSVLPRLAKAVDTFHGRLAMVDAGANVGVSTYLVSRQTCGWFFCLEPNPRFRSSLTHNLQQIPQSSARFVALSDLSKQSFAKHHYLDGNSNIETTKDGGDLLEFTTLDEMLEALPSRERPNLIKIDTEGFELKILRGTRRTIDTCQPTLFFEFFPAFIRREGDEPDTLFELLGMHGYDRLLFYDGGGCLMTSVTRSEPDELRALRRYCELRNSFFDVAAFHQNNSKLAEDFQRAESLFYEDSLRSRIAARGA